MALNLLQFLLAGIRPETWTTPTTVWDVRDYADVEVQFVGTPGTAYQMARSLDGTNYLPIPGYSGDGTENATITAAGIYRFSGNGYLKFTAGAGSTLTRRAGA